MTTARPVGSSLVAGQSDLKVSSATIRKELGALEDEGFLHQPHTSAGRVPTDKGYRYFVDALMEPLQLDPTRSDRIREFFARTHGELEAILSDTSRLLARVTGAAAVVVAPPPRSVPVRGVQLVKLDDRRLMLVVVMATGGIEQVGFELGDDMTDDQVSQAQGVLTRALIEQRPPDPTGDPATESLVADAIAAFNSAEVEPRVHVGGRSAVAGVFEQTEQVAQVLQLFERQLLVVSLIRGVLDRGMRVAIGPETGVVDLAECSLVVAPYAVDGDDLGSIGVLGPTHMNYPQALAAVAVISNQLSEHLDRG